MTAKAGVLSLAAVMETFITLIGKSVATLEYVPLPEDDAIHATEPVVAAKAGVLSLASVMETVSVPVAVSVAAVLDVALK